MTQRTERIDELLRQEISQALEREVSDPRIGFVTVTKVETVPDLSRARVWVSIIGTADERKQTLVALRGAMPYIRHGLNSKVKLRRIPDLDVKLDDTMERGTRVLQILNELSAGGTPDADAGGSGELLPTPVPRLHHDGDAVEEFLAAELAVEPAAKPRTRGSRRGQSDNKHGREDRPGRPAPRRRSK